VNTSALLKDSSADVDVSHRLLERLCIAGEDFVHRSTAIEDPAVLGDMLTEPDLANRMAHGVVL